MKKILSLTLVLIVIMMTSCTKEMENENENVNVNTNTNEDRYYVRYEVSVYSIYTANMSITLNTENGNQIFQVSGNSFSETFGPVERGFRASISASGTAGTYYTSIYVSRGGEPFVLKARGGETSEYIIDF